jgi:hypothetical protein
MAADRVIVLRCGRQLQALSGGYADLILADGNPLENTGLFANPCQKIDLTMRDGVMHDYRRTEYDGHHPLPAPRLDAFDT